jgi:Asp-tRNA(Asn)/Glu-tRNA(Gln) amidotransferase A subunit family amidase
MTARDPSPQPGVRSSAPTACDAPGQDLCFLSARALSHGYRSGEFSPLEVARAVLARIEAVNPRINALFYVDAEGAMAAAAASERRWLRGASLDALDGVPVTIKDSFAVAGMPMANGSRATVVDGTGAEDSPAAARLRQAGAVLLGKTTMPDFGMMASGISSQHGITRNPWALDRNSGGSSAGAGAAVAAGIGPIAVGSDIGGSVRIPASFCGAVGLKPSYGRVPLMHPWPALVGGPIARTVADAALMLGVISRPDVRDYTALPWDDRDYLAASEGEVRGLRLGLMTDIGFGLPVAPEVRSAVEAAARVFESLGAEIVVMPPMFDEDPEPDFDLMLQVYAWEDFGALTPEKQASVLPCIADWCRGGEGISGTALSGALTRIGAVRRRVVASCAGFDYVLTPTMAVEAYAADRPWPEGGTRHNPFCFPFNLSEQPALSVCCGFGSSGLPIGLQIVGRRFDDAGVLRVGRAFESVRPFGERRPSL